MLELELESDQIFVFTHAGEVIKLPTGATPIDFAYAIHSQVGHRCTGARMNGRMISIRTPLENGARVEIITSSKQAPNKDWLGYAVSSKALTRIRNHLRTLERGEAIRLGREKMLRETRRHVKKPEQLLKLEPFVQWMQRHGMNTLDDAFAAVGANRVNMKAMLRKIFPESGESSASAPPPARRARIKRKRLQLVSISGMDDLMVRFAKCCAPVYGDSIEGIITRGRGISIHRPDCHNLTEQLYKQRRVVEVQWVDNSDGLKPVSLAVRATTSMQELISLVDRLEEEEDAPITPGRITARRGVYTQHLTLMVGSSKQLDKILSRLNAMEGISAERNRESA
jgi:GTP pyrophosphokinase